MKGTEQWLATLAQVFIITSISSFSRSESIQANSILTITTNDVTSHYLAPNGEPKGILVFATWKSGGELLNELRNCDHRVLSYAYENNLGIFTWDCLESPPASIAYEEKVRSIGKTIEILDGRLEGIQKSRLIPDLVLGFGMSRGVSYVQAWACKRPGRFDAVSLHCGGFFEREEFKSSDTIWFISSGQYDYNRSVSLAAARELIKQKKLVLYKEIPDLGHASRPDYDLFVARFFDYIILVRDEYSNTSTSIAFQKLLERDGGRRYCIPSRDKR